MTLLQYLPLRLGGESLCLHEGYWHATDEQMSNRLLGVSLV